MSDDEIPPPPPALPPTPPPPPRAPETSEVDGGAGPPSSGPIVPGIAGVEPASSPPPLSPPPPIDVAPVSPVSPPPIDVAPPSPPVSSPPVGAAPTFVASHSPSPATPGPPSQSAEADGAGAGVDRPVMPDASAGPGQTDPHGLGAALARLDAQSRRGARTVALLVASVLGPGERVESVVSGRFLGASALVAVTDRRMLVVNDREWEPDIVPVGLEPGLEVEGRQDEHRAALVFRRGVAELVVDEIADTEAAREVAIMVRARVGQ